MTPARARTLLIAVERSTRFAPHHQRPVLRAVLTEVERATNPPAAAAAAARWARELLRTA